MDELKVKNESKLNELKDDLWERLDCISAAYPDSYEESAPDEDDIKEIILPELEADYEPPKAARNRLCQKCGIAVDDDAVFCEFCGTKLEIPQPKVETKDIPRFCSQCGKPLIEGARFCVNCGNKIQL